LSYIFKTVIVSKQQFKARLFPLYCIHARQSIGRKASHISCHITCHCTDSWKYSVCAQMEICRINYPCKPATAR